MKIHSWFIRERSFWLHTSIIWVVRGNEMNILYYIKYEKEKKLRRNFIISRPRVTGLCSFIRSSFSLSNLKALHSQFSFILKHEKSTDFFLLCVFSRQGEKFIYSYENCVAAAKRENTTKIYFLTQLKVSTKKHYQWERMRAFSFFFFIILYSIHRDYLHYIHNKNSILLTTWILSFCLTLHVLFCCFARSFFLRWSK